MEDKYIIITTGKTVAGFSADQVSANLSKLLKTSLDKAKHISTRRCKLKEGLSLEAAKNYHAKLSCIGVEVEIKRQKPKIKPSNLSLEPMVSESVNATAGSEQASADIKASNLTLEPMNEHQSADSNGYARSKDLAKEKTVSPIDHHCPKCGAPNQTEEQCSECGVYINKVLARSDPSNDQDVKPRKSAQKLTSGINAHEGQESDIGVYNGLNSKAIAIGIAVAILGAWLWRFIALTFGFELGLVAWLVGGAIGFCVALSGTRGENVGIACAVLASLAILGGKYLVATGFQTQIAAVFSEEIFADSLQYAYDEEVSLAERFISAKEQEDAGIRTFMVDYGYSFADSSERVSDAEFSDFMTHSAPRLTEIAETGMSFTDWQASMVDVTESYSSWDIYTSSFGWLDALFLFLGVGTAYRLGKGQG